MKFIMRNIVLPITIDLVGATWNEFSVFFSVLQHKLNATIVCLQWILIYLLFLLSLFYGNGIFNCNWNGFWQIVDEIEEKIKRKGRKWNLPGSVSKVCGGGCDNGPGVLPLPGERTSSFIAPPYDRDELGGR